MTVRQCSIAGWLGPTALRRGFTRVRWDRRKERGTTAALRALRWIATTFGRAPARLLLSPIALYFALTSASTCRASREFLARALGRRATFVDVLRHVYTFASVSLDRVYFLARSHDFDVHFHRPDAVGELTRSRGCLLFVAHFGSFEVLRAGALFDERLKLRIVLDQKVGSRFMAALAGIAPEVAAGILDSSHGGPAHALRVREALEGGAVVGMMVDRTRQGERTVAVDFLGAETRLPAGPWVLAAALRVPVIAAFAAWRGGNRYDVHFDILAVPLELPREGREAALRHQVQRYADRLAEHVRDAPYNWSNFYDFWGSASARD